MAALLVLLLLLAVPPTAFTTTDVYYVTAHDAAGHEQSCAPHQNMPQPLPTTCKHPPQLTTKTS